METTYRSVVDQEVFRAMANKRNSLPWHRIVTKLVSSVIIADTIILYASANWECERRLAWFRNNQIILKSQIVNPTLDLRGLVAGRSYSYFKRKASCY